MITLVMVKSGPLSTFKQQFPYHALGPTRTVTSIMLYLDHSDMPITSCHSMHMCMPLQFNVSVSLPPDSNSIHSHNFLTIKVHP